MACRQATEAPRRTDTPGQPYVENGDQWRTINDGPTRFAVLRQIRQRTPSLSQLAAAAAGTAAGAGETLLPLLSRESVR